MMLFTPFVAVLGSLAFLAVLGLTIAPPLLAIVCVIGGDYLWAFASAIVWLVWLRFGGPVRRFVFEGFEQGGL